ncbi:hypothetical protein CEXT_20561 [Caerostris extrusa]|uniref:Transposase n=1 Tax=Caerostris extrusa TaxID=172846 RepID=A0AAV4QTF7_CAEEX|nr:hypothetical protein CEXT_20561 [Caerostris extrusa]
MTKNLTKHYEYSEMLRPLALEVINNIPSQALVICTDGTKYDSERTVSGVFMKSGFRYRFRNLDHSLMFRSVLITIKSP